MKLRNSLSAFSIWLVFFTGEEKEIKPPPVTKSTIGTNDEFCGITNKAFQAGEQVTFHVYYSVVGPISMRAPLLSLPRWKILEIDRCIM